MRIEKHITVDNTKAGKFVIQANASGIPIDLEIYRCEICYRNTSKHILYFYLIFSEIFRLESFNLQATASYTRNILTNKIINEDMCYGCV